MARKFTFDKDFQQEVISLAFQKWDFLVFAADVVQPDYFDDKILIWFYQALIAHYRKYNQKPSLSVMKNEMLKAVKSKRIKEEEISAYLEVYQELDEEVVAEEYIRDEVVRFCRRQKLKRTVMELVEMAHSEDDAVWDAMVDKIADVVNVGANAQDMGTQYFKDWEERLRARRMGEDKITIPTGITDLDDVIGGGLKTSQLMIWMAGTAVGKSIALAHCGKRAVVQGFKVVHYTLELSEQDIADRYDSSWSRIPISTLEDNETQLAAKLQRYGKAYGNSLIIKEYPTKSATVNTLRSHLTMLINNGYTPDLVIVDYLDLLKPLTNYSDAYADLGTLTAHLRGLAGEFKIPIQTATQVNRSGMQSDVVELAHVSDSFAKMFVADVVVAICMNREERAANRARLFTSKNRNGPANVEVKINTAYERMCFFDPAPKGEPVEAMVDETVMVRKKKKRKLKEVDFPVNEN